MPQLARDRATCRRSAGWLASSARSGTRSARGSCSNAARGGAASKQADLPPAARRLRAARPDLHQARPDHLRRRGALPRRARRTSSSCCATACPPRTFDDVRRVVEMELGRSLDDVFVSFDRTPIAAASIAQVHAARLRTGEAGRREGAAPADRASSSAPTSRRWRGSRRASPAASRSPRSRTRPRWSSCSRRRSSKSSTSGSKRRTCSTSPRARGDRASARTIVPRPHPTLVTKRVLVMERLRRHPVGRRRRDARRRRRHRSGAARRARRRSWKARCCTASSTATCTAATSWCSPTAAPCSWTSASPAGSTRRSAWRS